MRLYFAAAACRCSCIPLGRYTKAAPQRAEVAMWQAAAEARCGDDESESLSEVN